MSPHPLQQPRALRRNLPHAQHHRADLAQLRRSPHPASHRPAGAQLRRSRHPASHRPADAQPRRSPHPASHRPADAQPRRSRPVPHRQAAEPRPRNRRPRLPEADRDGLWKKMLRSLDNSRRNTADSQRSAQDGQRNARIRELENEVERFRRALPRMLCSRARLVHRLSARLWKKRIARSISKKSRAYIRTQDLLKQSGQPTCPVKRPTRVSLHNRRRRRR